MKRKFQFLRRRNTDTALVPKFALPLHYTIPSYEQAFQWSRSFDSLLNDKCKLHKSNVQIGLYLQFFVEGLVYLICYLYLIAYSGDYMTSCALGFWWEPCCSSFLIFCGVFIALFVFDLCLVHHMLRASLDFPLFIAPSSFSDASSTIIVISVMYIQLPYDHKDDGR